MRINSTNLDEISVITKENNLKHIAIIMDGNRRWAKAKHLPSMIGHQKGVESLRKTIKACLKFGIKYLTVYAFSTENWNRDKKEVDFLMELLAKTITAEIPEFLSNDVKLSFIGDRYSLSEEICNIIQKGETETQNCKSLNLQIAFNYGSRMEIINALKNICQKVQDGALEISDITENLISENLYTYNIPDPDLLIRTGGEKRISNYLLWQIAYTEIYVTELFWPDFDENALAMAILDFNKRNRRFGK